MSLKIYTEIVAGTYNSLNDYPEEHQSVRFQDNQSDHKDLMYCISFLAFLHYLLFCHSGRSLP